MVSEQFDSGRMKTQYEDFQSCEESEYMEAKLVKIKEHFGSINKDMQKMIKMLDKMIVSQEEIHKRTLKRTVQSDRVEIDSHSDPNPVSEWNPIDDLYPDLVQEEREDCEEDEIYEDVGEKISNTSNFLIDVKEEIIEGEKMASEMNVNRSRYSPVAINESMLMERSQSKIFHVIAKFWGDESRTLKFEIPRAPFSGKSDQGGRTDPYEFVLHPNPDLDPVPSDVYNQWFHISWPTSCSSLTSSTPIGVGYNKGRPSPITAHGMDQLSIRSGPTKCSVRSREEADRQIFEDGLKILLYE